VGLSISHTDIYELVGISVGNCLRLIEVHCNNFLVSFIFNDYIYDMHLTMNVLTLVRSRYGILRSSSAPFK
jgi:hypothetical protein